MTSVQLPPLGGSEHKFSRLFSTVGVQNTLPATVIIFTNCVFKNVISILYIIHAK